MIWHLDPWYGWLEVPAADVRASGANITSFSYISHDGRTAYLEEDLDASAYIKAAGIPDEQARSAPQRHTDGRSFIRDLPSFA